MKLLCLGPLSALLVMQGIKRCHTAHCYHEYRGPVAIVAWLRPRGDAESRRALAGGPVPGRLPRPGVLGFADVVDCVAIPRRESTRRALREAWDEHGLIDNPFARPPWALVLADPEPLERQLLIHDREGLVDWARRLPGFDPDDLLFL